MSSTKDQIRYEYQCSQGHALGANAPQTRCPAIVRGTPCKGTLVRVGAGSRKAAA